MKNNESLYTTALLLLHERKNSEKNQETLKNILRAAGEQVSTELLDILFNIYTETNFATLETLIHTQRSRTAVKVEEPVQKAKVEEPVEERKMDFGSFFA
jgi:hypothetical protein